MAFHPYTQIIPQVFNPGGFGPPHGLTRASTCPCVDHSASGPQHATKNALFRLAFATAPPHGLTSPHTMTRRLILQKARGHITTHPKADYAPTACRHTVSGTISRPLTGALFTFPSRYWSTIGHQEVFRLTRWSWQIHTGFLEPRATWEHPQGSLRSFAYPAITVYGPASQQARLPHRFITPRSPGRDCKQGPTTPDTQRPPAITRARFSLLRFRSPLLTESLLFSSPTGTEMFHFPALPPTALYIQTAATPHDWCQVSPFGHPRINVWLATPRGLTQPPTSFIGS